MKAKCITLATIFRTSVGSVNASFTEENVGVVKKVTLPNGDELPYISGQAMRRYLRDKMEEMGHTLSPVTQSPTPAGRTASSKCDPITYIDDDLFGFMLAGESNYKRISPVKVSPAIAFFPFRDDRDLGVRITEEGKKDPKKLMPPFETEVYYNYFYWNLMVDLERVGEFANDIFGKNKPPKSLSIDDKKSRLKILLTAVRDLWGGGKQSRFLTDISPKVVIYASLSSKKPIFLERIRMHKDQTIDKQSIQQVYLDERSITHSFIMGVSDSFGGIASGSKLGISNGGQVEIEIQPLSKAFDKLVEDAQSALE